MKAKEALQEIYLGFGKKKPVIGELPKMPFQKFPKISHREPTTGTTAVVLPGGESVTVNRSKQGFRVHVASEGGEAEVHMLPDEARRLAMALMGRQE